VVALLTLLCFQACTGLFANDDVHFNAPLAMLISKDSSDRVTELHAALFNVLMLLVWMHVVAVGFYLFVKGENLIKPMLTGNKDAARVPGEVKLRFGRISLALLLWTLSAGLALWISRP
jgi:cytochrome b